MDEHDVVEFDATVQVALDAVVDLPGTGSRLLGVAGMGRVERQGPWCREHRSRLAADGRHLERGVLHDGPPGTAKRHTVR